MSAGTAGATDDPPGGAPLRPGAPGGAHRATELDAELRATSQALDEARATLQALFASAVDVIVVFDGAGLITSINGAARHLVGIEPDQLVGRSVRDVLVARRASAGTAPTGHPDSAVGRAGSIVEGRVRRPDGRLVPVELSVNRVRSPDRELYVAIVRDLSHRLRSEARWRHRASVDPLTGLVNRTALHRSLARSMRRVDEGRRLALLFIDLDGFKAVNDTHGHAVGDAVLRAAARRVTEAVRSEDLVARYGGDEFVVVLEADDDVAVEVAMVSARIAEAFERPFAVGGATHHVGASLGHAIYDDDASTISQLIAAADDAMYRAKRAGRDRRRG